MKKTIAIIAAAAALAGPLALAATPAHACFGCGIKFNSKNFNGLQLNGVQFNGPGLVFQGVKQNGLRLNGPGLVLQGVKLNGVDSARIKPWPTVLSSPRITVRAVTLGSGVKVVIR
jgi:hypothetical protein